MKPCNTQHPGSWLALRASMGLEPFHEDPHSGALQAVLIYIYISIYTTCVYIYTYMYGNINERLSMYTMSYVYSYIYVYIYICTHACLCVYTDMQICLRRYESVFCVKHFEASMAKACMIINTAQGQVRGCMLGSSAGASKLPKIMVFMPTMKGCLEVQVGRCRVFQVSERGFMFTSHDVGGWCLCTWMLCSLPLALTNPMDPAGFCNSPKQITRVY